MQQENKKGIGFFGSIVVDRVLNIESWPAEGTLGLIQGRETLGTGGSAWNDPVNIRAIDADVPLYACGVIGDDAMGRYALNHLQERSIDTSHVDVANDADTSYSIVSNSRASGLRTHLHAKGACDRFTCAHIDAFASRLAIAHLGYLMLLEALEREEGSELMAVRALRSLGEKADKVAVDIVSLDNSTDRFRKIVTPCLPHVDYLIINEFEAGQITGEEIRNADHSLDGQACLRAARELLRQGVRDTVIIHFPEGALGMSTSSTEFCPSFEVPQQEIDCVVGAGDAFTSAALYGFYRGRTLAECLLLGNANARHNIVSSSCTDGVVSLASLEETIANEPQRASILQIDG
ncbi:carbohydrate kinase family protein [Aporhodopirellula aestuarii]|uniref:Carbohydrate kinase family protein n=1 Tax=Aporhodopirellula aestuarii TaxID=2950107 RepID=A0ABT0UDU6_9BACT|nr:carbohydrate kinase family protein [Aporhodopirellula aestuarii]MCM2375059.1 carbohydrate kinase family protein [Aporhodopirellula aestuarii]